MNLILLLSKYDFQESIPTAGEMRFREVDEESEVDLADLDPSPNGIYFGRQIAEAQTFLAMASVSEVELDNCPVKAGTVVSLPISHRGKTKVRFAGATPAFKVEKDEIGNLQVILPANCVMSVDFNRRVDKKHVVSQRKVYSTL
jgi:hypothetical protein